MPLGQATERGVLMSHFTRTVFVVFLAVSGALLCVDRSTSDAAAALPCSTSFLPTLPPPDVEEDAPDCDGLKEGPSSEGENECSGSKLNESFGGPPGGGDGPPPPGPSGPSGPDRRNRPTPPPPDPPPGASTPGPEGRPTPSTPGPGGPGTPDPNGTSSGPSSPGASAPSAPQAVPGGDPGAANPTTPRGGARGSAPGGVVDVAEGEAEIEEMDASYPGMYAGLDLEIGRRYFSRLEAELAGSTGDLWVHSFFERLVDMGGGAIGHLSWKRPQADQAYAYQPIDGDGPANGWKAPVCVGGRIDLASPPQFPSAAYCLTHKTKFKSYFDSAGRILYRVSPSGLDYVRFVYDAFGELTAVVDSRGQQFNVRVENGRIVEIENPVTEKITYDYDGNKLSTVTYPARDIHSNSFDASGDPVSEDWNDVEHRTSTRSYSYNAAGKLEEIKNDANQIVLWIQYHSEDPFSPDSSRIHQMSKGEGGVWEFVRTGNSLMVTTPRGFQREWLMDAQDKPIELREYKANVNPSVPSRATSGYDAWTFEYYEECGPMLKSITMPSGVKQEYLYDEDYNTTAIRRWADDASGYLESTWTYDAEGRIETYTSPSASASAEPSEFRYTFTYTSLPPSHPVAPNGTEVVLTNPAGGIRAEPVTWVWRYDTHRRLVEYEGPDRDDATLGEYQRFEYYGSGQGGNTHMPKRLYPRRGSSMWYEYAYNSNGFLESVTTSTGFSFTREYDENNQIVAWSGPDRGSQQYRFEARFDAEGRVSKTRYRYYDRGPSIGPADPYVWIESASWYDRSDNVLFTMDDVEPGTIALTEYHYDLENNLVQEIDPDGKVSTATFDEKNLPWVLTDALGTPAVRTWTADYTADGQIYRTTTPLDASTTTEVFREYDKYGRLQWIEVPELNREEQILDEDGRVTEIRSHAIIGGGTFHVVAKEKFEYNDWHDGPTKRINYVYDQKGIFLQRQVETEFEYGASGLPLEITVEGTVYARFEYEPWGVPKAIYDDEGNREEIDYDPLTGYQSAHRTVLADPLGTPLTLETQFATDPAGRVLSKTFVAPAQPNAVETFEYDSLDNIVRSTDPHASIQETVYGYDGRPLVLRYDVDEPSGIPSRFETRTYSPGGLLESATDNRDNTVVWEYDGRQRLYREVQPDSSYWEWNYNLSDFLTSARTPSGRAIEFEYNDRGRLIRRIFKDAEDLIVRTDDIGWTPLGHLRQVTKTEGGQSTSVTFTRDTEGYPLTEKQDSTLVTYARDSLGRLSQLVAPNSTRTYTYDSRNRVRTLQDGGAAPVAVFDYLGSGPASRRILLRNGSGVLVGRDGFAHIDNIRTVLGPVDIFEYAYDWSSGGRLNYEHRIHDGGGDVYRYDNLGRLEEFVRDSVDPPAEFASAGSTAHAYTREFNLDADFHRTSVVTTPDGEASYAEDYTTHPERNHYTSVGGVSRTMSLDGNLLTDGTRSYFYDPNDNLIRVEDGGNVVAEYTYDALDRRKTRTADGVTTTYVYAGPWVLEELRSDGGPAQFEAANFHGMGVDNVVMAKRVDRNDLDDDEDTSEIIDLFYHKNQLGSVMALTLDDGTVVEQYRYEAFGAPTIWDSTGNQVLAPPSGNAFLFTGREYDPATGLYHYRAREYEPKTGGFLQEDPLGLVDSLNPVAYVLGNPVYLGDPFGMSALGDAVGDLMDFVDENKGLIGDLALDVLGPLGDLLDVIGAVIGKDVRGWIVGGFSGSMADLGWWQRAKKGLGGALLVAGGAIAVIPKLKKALGKLKKLASQLQNRAPGGCFAAGTLVLLANGSCVPIEDIQLGDSVACTERAGFTADGSELAASTQLSVVNWQEWRAVWFDFDDGSRVGLLRPLDWFEGSGISEGENVAVYLPEVITPQLATRVQVEECPVDSIEEAPGRRAVTGVFVRAVDELVHIRLESGEVIRTTSGHPFYNADSRSWMPAGSLSKGDRLLKQDGGEARVAGAKRVAQRQRVYNLEVYGSHTYHVGYESLLVHNNCGFAARGAGKAGKTGTPNSIYEQLDDAGNVRSRTFYGENGRPFSRQDFDHPHGGMQPHEHNRTFDADGRPITPRTTRPLPPGYDNKPSGS